MEVRPVVGIVVGVGNYKHLELTPLPFTVTDSIAASLLDQVTLLTNRKARREDLSASLFEWLPARSVSADTVVFISPDMERW